MEAKKINDEYWIRADDLLSFIEDLREANKWLGFLENEVKLSIKREEMLNRVK